MYYLIVKLNKKLMMKGKTSFVHMYMQEINIHDVCIIFTNMFPTGRNLVNASYKVVQASYKVAICCTSLVYE